ncbi:hypothetical protein HMPREF2532_03521 [Bacteroides ovatus]|nr:hypothetical protein HMPREF2532_03521 [Bacteroides ovatus]
MWKKVIIFSSSIPMVWEKKYSRQEFLFRIRSFANAKQVLHQ